MKRLLVILAMLTATSAWADFYMAGSSKCVRTDGSLVQFIDWAVKNGHIVTEMNFPCRGCAGKVFVAEEKTTSLKAVMFENRTACRVYIGMRNEMLNIK
jgi:hypothetical protein